MTAAATTETTPTFTPDQVETIRIIKSEVIQNAKIAQVLQDIVNIFSAIRSEVAEVETKGSKTKMSILVDSRNQLIQLHEEVTKTKNRLIQAFSFSSGSNNIHSNSMIFSRKGFSHRSDAESSASKNPLEEKDECPRLLREFYEKLNKIAREILS